MFSDYAGWLACPKLDDLTKHLEVMVGDDFRDTRKSRLFGCGCCRVVWAKLSPFGRCAVEAAELFADGRIDRPALATAHQAILSRPKPFSLADTAALNVCEPNSYSWDTARYIAKKVVGEITGVKEIRKQARHPEMARLIAILRDIIGNSFHNPEPATFPVIVTQLARAVYEGNDSTFALADALEETGHSGLAEHFRQPGSNHPKGCWALDVILGWNDLPERISKEEEAARQWMLCRAIADILADGKQWKAARVEALLANDKTAAQLVQALRTNDGASDRIASYLRSKGASCSNLTDVEDKAIRDALVELSDAGTFVAAGSHYLMENQGLSAVDARIHFFMEAYDMTKEAAVTFLLEALQAKTRARGRETDATLTAPSDAKPTKAAKRPQPKRRRPKNGK